MRKPAATSKKSTPAPDRRTRTTAGSPAIKNEASRPPAPVVNNVGEAASQIQNPTSRERPTRNDADSQDYRASFDKGLRARFRASTDSGRLLSLLIFVFGASVSSSVVMFMSWGLVSLPVICAVMGLGLTLVATYMVWLTLCRFLPCPPRGSGPGAARRTQSQKVHCQGESALSVADPSRSPAAVVIGNIRQDGGSHVAPVFDHVPIRVGRSLGNRHVHQHSEWIVESEFRNRMHSVDSRRTPVIPSRRITSVSALMECSQN